MKKLIILLFAAVLLAGITTPARAALQAVGPVNVATGYPMWYEDTTGLRLDLCLDQNGMCLFALPNPAAPATVPGNWDPAGESFYWLAEADIAAPGVEALLVLAMESAFLGAIVPGGQDTFTRIRVRITPTLAGDYTVTHPYGTVLLAGLAAGDTQTFTLDVGLGVAVSAVVPPGSDALPNGPAGDFNGGITIGPFLRPTTAPVVVGGNTYLANPATPVTVTGSPTGNNFFQITGPGVNVTQTLFAVLGKISNCLATNVAPVAVADPAAATATGQAKIINVTTNDTAGTVPINPAAIAVTVPPASGTVARNVDGTVTYTPNANFFGQDSFTYTVQDMCALTSNAVAVPVMVEKLVADKAEFRARTGKWSITGSSNFPSVPLPAPGQPNVVTLHKGDITKPIGTAPVQADGTWKFQGKSKVPPGAASQAIQMESAAGVIVNTPVKMR